MKFQWLNESEIKLTDDRIEIVAPGQTDFFCGSIDECEEGILPESLCNAPYYYTEVEGDFVLRVKVSHGFKDTYDSASVMVMKDETCWAKCCYELTDFGTHAAVTWSPRVIPMTPTAAIWKATPHGSRCAAWETTLRSITLWTAKTST